jgi:predicted AlkP superfamily phosphohydrolase/phosphomutase
LAAFLLACSKPPEGPPGSETPPAKAPKVVILGFDGVDPDRVQEMWGQGKLPHLKELATQGSFRRLGTTDPPQSPVAWASFATGMRPGKHGVFDFIARDPQTYLPRMGAVEYRGAQFGRTGELIAGVTGRNLRRGEAFWQTLSREGIRVEVLNVPYSWPPEPVANGSVASGLGVPDLRPTNSTSTVFSTDFSTPPPSHGGVRTVAVTWNGTQAQADLEGPRGADGRRARVALSFDSLAPATTGGKPRLEIGLNNQRVVVTEGDWSSWNKVRFNLGTKGAVTGRVRFFLGEASESRLHLYASALGADPEEPFVVLSHPSDYACELERRAGPYNTVGWEEDTSALNAELLPDRAFLDDLMTTMNQREQMTLAALEGTPPDLLISVWTGTDRASHMFWRLEDPESPRYDSTLAETLSGAISMTYERMDEIVGAVRARLSKETLLFVLSDHGFHGFERGVHVNRWLVDQGYLTLRPGGMSLADADWKSTQAYALGTGQIYLNLQGRERLGTVPFGPPRESLLAEIKTGLLALKDGERSPVAAVTEGTSIYVGGAAANAPDLLVSFSPGYQASWATRLGGAPEGLFEENSKKWSGGHASSLASETEGIFFSSQAHEVGDPSIEDIGPSLLQLFEKEIPPEMDGAPIL